MQQVVSGHKDTPQRTSLRDSQYQLPTRSSVDNQNLPGSSGTCSNHVSLTDQQHYPSRLQRRNGRNVDRDSGDPLGNSKHYPHGCNGGCCGPHGAQGDGEGSSPDDPYGGG